MEKATPSTLCFLTNATSIYRALQVSFSHSAQNIHANKLRYEIKNELKDNFLTSYSAFAVDEETRLTDIQLAVQMLRSDLESAIHNTRNSVPFVQDKLGMPNKAYNAYFEKKIKELEELNNLNCDVSALSAFGVQHSLMSYFVFVFFYHTSKKKDTNIAYIGDVEKTKMALFVTPFDPNGLQPK